jgi:uncharacterized membrane protein SpoIIM required for sporulation
VKPVVLRSARFRQERVRRWRELDSIVTRVGSRGVRALAEDDAARLPGLYRAALASLSVARAISLDKNVVDYLTSLCSRAFFVVYGTRHRFGESVAGFFGRHFPATVRRRWASIALAASILVAGVVVGFVRTAADPEHYWSFVDPGMAGERTPWSSAEELRDILYPPKDAEGDFALFSAFLFSHNSQVVFLCFALGAALGLPVAYVLFLNGASLGAMSQIHHAHGLAADWWGWLLPHGVTELLAIVLAGGAGLELGRTIVFPGTMRRVDALARRGREAGTMVLACVALLFVAALVEGFLRQLVPSIVLRYVFTAASLLFWIVYLGLAGRGAPDAEPEEDAA